MFVGDLIELVLKAVDGHGSTGVYHASSGLDYAIRELFDATVEALALDPAPEIEIRDRSPGDAYTILLDPSRTQEEFDWRPETSLREGVRAAISYYEAFGIDETYTHLRLTERPPAG